MKKKNKKMDFSSSITIIRSSSKTKSDTIVNHCNSHSRRCRSVLQKQQDQSSSLDTSYNKDRHVSYEYFDLTDKNTTHLSNTRLSLQPYHRMMEMSSSQEEENYFADQSQSSLQDEDPDTSNEKIDSFEEQLVVFRTRNIEKEERSKRCASVGPLLRRQQNNTLTVHDKRKARVSMYELANKGWIYEENVKKNVLELDGEITDIMKTNSRAVVSLGNLKLIF